MSEIGANYLFNSEIFKDLESKLFHHNIEEQQISLICIGKIG